MSLEQQLARHTRDMLNGAIAAVDLWIESRPEDDRWDQASTHDLASLAGALELLLAQYCHLFPHDEEDI